MTEDAQAILLEGFRLPRRYLTPATAPTLTVCHKLHIPDDPRIITAVSEVLALLCNPDTWEESGGLTGMETAALTTEMLYNMLNSDCDIGTIKPYATAEIPPNMLPCDGTEYADADYPVLAARIHSVFRVDGSHFRTPKIVGRGVVGLGVADDDAGVIDWAMGATSGADEIVLTTEQMPAHTHEDSGHTHGYITPTPLIVNGGLEAPATSATPTGGITDVGNANLTNTGGDEAHSNVQPSIGLPYGIVWR